jgi:putative ABC transport system permease protein
LRAGRTLTPADRAGSAPVAVINETAARQFWPGESPIGKQVRFGPTTGFTDPAHPVEIVGVVGDVKYEGLDQPVGPDFYTSYLQFSYPDTMVLVKTRGPSASIVPALRAAVASVDAAVPLYEVMTLDERVSRAMGRPRFNALVLTMFAGAALLLAALGVYGLILYAVSSRMREIGVRLALGATPRRVVGHFVGQSVRLAGVGVAIGLAAALAIARVAQALVADLGAVSLRVPIVVGLVVAVVAAAAAFLPARRAGAVDPIVVLKQE